jgi:hypothetical protein
MLTSSFGRTPDGERSIVEKEEEMGGFLYKNAHFYEGTLIWDV